MFFEFIIGEFENTPFLSSKPKTYLTNN